PLAVTSPDWTPCVTTGRSAAREREGIAIEPSAPAPVARKRRRENFKFMKIRSDPELAGKSVIPGAMLRIAPE
ncbi:hypothetical protein, partial [Bradyrhizobium sp. PRIMUS42]|uniref:hypothetical protein n=1 Tax=Bradyrhizobium sp. PRIMUS42 TaxID=2908926 RepID=UPI001FF6A30E